MPCWNLFPKLTPISLKCGSKQNGVMAAFLSFRSPAQIPKICSIGSSSVSDPVPTLVQQVPIQSLVNRHKVRFWTLLDNIAVGAAVKFRCGKFFRGAQAYDVSSYHVHVMSKTALILANGAGGCKIANTINRNIIHSTRQYCMGEKLQKLQRARPGPRPRKGPRPSPGTGTGPSQRAENCLNKIANILEKINICNSFAVLSSGIFLIKC